MRAVTGENYIPMLEIDGEVLVGSNWEKIGNALENAVRRRHQEPVAQQ